MHYGSQDYERTTIYDSAGNGLVENAIQWDQEPGYFDGEPGRADRASYLELGLWAQCMAHQQVPAFPWLYQL